MKSVSAIVRQLKKERNVVAKQLEGLNAALSAFVGVYTGAKPAGKRRKLSAEARAKIAAAQRKRWSKIKGVKAKALKKR
jgi:hypothetical protein